MHIDCDLRSSTQAVFPRPRERIASGTITLFDEHFSYPGWEMHEFKAFKEIVESTGLQHEFIGLHPKHRQPAVRATGTKVRRAAA